MVGTSVKIPLIVSEVMDLEIRSEVLKEAFAAKFKASLSEESNVPSVLCTPSCDFCAFVLFFLRKRTISAHDLEVALQELKQLYTNKKFEFNQNLTHGFTSSSGCLSYLMTCQELQDCSNKDVYLSFLEDLLPVTNPYLKDRNGNDILKVAIYNKFSSDFIQSIVSFMEDKMDSRELNVQLNERNINQESALSLAVKNSMDAVVTILTSCSSVSTVNIDGEGNCLLHFIHKFRTKIWRRFLLLKDAKNNCGYFPLQNAALNKVEMDDETFKKLIPSKQLVNDVNVFNETLLQALLKHKDWFSCERIAIMCEAGADLKKTLKDPHANLTLGSSALTKETSTEVSSGNLPSPANNPFFLDTLCKVLDDTDDVFSRDNTAQKNSLVNSIIIGTQSNASSRPSSFPSVEDESTSSGYVTAPDTDFIMEPVEQSLLVPSSHRSGRLSGNILSLDIPSAGTFQNTTSSIWNSTPVVAEVLPKAKSFASVAATKTSSKQESNFVVMKKVGAVGSKKMYQFNREILEKLSSSPAYTGKVNPSCIQSFSEFKRILFDTGRYKEIFKKYIRVSVDSACDVNSLIPTYGSKKKINRLFSDCATKLRAQPGRAVIEMTRIFISFKVDFNLKGNGENTNKASLMNVIKICESCNWTPDEQVELIRLIVLEGNGDPLITDNVGNDALKLAVHLKLPTGIIQILCERALETNNSDLFYSYNNFKQNILSIAATLDKSSPTRDYLVTSLSDAKRREDELIASQEKKLVHKCAIDPIGPLRNIVSLSQPQPAIVIKKDQNLALQFADFFARYPKAGNISYILSQFKDVNSNYENTPLYSACLERILSLTLKLTSKENTKSQSETQKLIKVILDAAYDMTKHFVLLKVDFNRRNYNDKTCLLHTISLSKHYYFRKFFYSLIDLMIENGADVTLTDSRGDDCLKHALFRKYPLEVIGKILKAAGNKEKAVLISHNQDDLSTLDIARNHQEVFVFLRDRLTFLRRNSLEDYKTGGVRIGKNMDDPDREDRFKVVSENNKYDNTKLKLSDFIDVRSKMSQPTTPVKSSFKISSLNGDTSDRVSVSSSNSSGVSCGSPLPVSNPPSLTSFSNVPQVDDTSNRYSSVLFNRTYMNFQTDQDSAWNGYPDFTM